VAHRYFFFTKSAEKTNDVILKGEKRVQEDCLLFVLAVLALAVFTVFLFFLKSKQVLNHMETHSNRLLW
jgi:hypothetical protein